MMRHGTRTLIIAAALAAGAACSTELVGPPVGPLVTGTWNGPHLSLSLDVAGGVTEYDCAHGGLGAPIVLDDLGRFRVTGVHIPEHGGPVWEGEAADSLPATYWGVVRGAVLTMQVEVGKDTLGPFELRRDHPVRLMRCL